MFGAHFASARLVGSGFLSAPRLTLRSSRDKAEPSNSLPGGQVHRIYRFSSVFEICDVSPAIQPRAMVDSGSARMAALLSQLRHRGPGDCHGFCGRARARESEVCRVQTMDFSGSYGSTKVPIFLSISSGCFANIGQVEGEVCSSVVEIVSHSGPR